MEASDSAAVEEKPEVPKPEEEESTKPPTEAEEKKAEEKQELPPAVAVAIPAEPPAAAEEEEAKKEDVATAAAEASAATTVEAAPEEDDANAIWEPAPQDVLSGRGASVNAHPGNKKFRALCFARKPEFEAGNHAAKRRVATEIVTTTFDGGKARFLKKKGEKGPWYEMTKEQAILKACQVMRDYKRPDRMAMREMMQQNGHARKRSRSAEPSTPLLDTVRSILFQPCGSGNIGSNHFSRLSLSLYLSLHPLACSYRTFGTHY